MKIIENIVSGFQLSYPIEKKCAPEEILFLDIETTGFTARSSQLYLIGLAFYKNGNWYYKQFFADTAADEEPMLKAFAEFASSYKTLIHFNGNNFDVPFLDEKMKTYRIDFSFDSFQAIDLYRRISPYKKFLKVLDLKQKTLELYLGINRQDEYNGGELINLYLEYQKNPDEDLLITLLLHNADDVRGMMMLLPILSFYDLFNDPLTVKKVQANHYTNPSGQNMAELVMKVVFPTAIPTPISCRASGCYFNGEGEEGMLRVPMYEGELKYFYAGYKDYYYLPQEDQAMHKSIASYVDKDHREQATAATCYTRKEGVFLPEWDLLFTPFFKPDYRSKDKFFELTPERKTNRQFFSEYASHILAFMATGNI